MLAGMLSSMRVSAFLTRSVRQDSRMLSHHIMRAVLALVVLALFFTQLENYTQRGTTGGTFASWVIYCCYWFLSLVGGLHFSTAVVEEKEEQTLALLKMTGIPTFGVLTGKSLPRLAIAMLFIAVIAPFLILSQTLGGVLPLGLMSSILNLLTYAILLSQIGLFASVVSRNATQAFTLTFIIWLVIEFSDWVLWMFAINRVSLVLPTSDVVFLDAVIGGINDFVGRLGELSLRGNLDSTLLAYRTINLPPDATVWQKISATASEVWTFRMGCQLVIAFGLFLLSWICFEPFTRRAVATAGDQPDLQKKLALPVIRVWQPALVWKAWRHTSGGLLWFLARLVLLPALIFGVVAAIMVGFFGELEFDALCGFSCFLGFFMFFISSFRVLGRVFNSEIYDKTLVSLVMLPQEIAKTLAQMMVGVLPAVIASSSCFFLAFFLIMLRALSRHSGVSDIFEAVLEPWFWHSLTVIAVTMHIGLFLTTCFRYGGMLVAFALVFLSTMFLSVVISVLSMLVMDFTESEIFVRYILPLVLIFGELIICCSMWLLIGRRLRMLAAR